MGELGLEERLRMTLALESLRQLAGVEHVELQPTRKPRYHRYLLAKV